MTHDRVTTLLTKLERGLTKSHQFFESLHSDRWDSPVSPEAEAWTVRQMLWHFIYSEEYLLRIAQDIAQGGPGVTDLKEIDRFNQQEMEKLPGLAGAELLEYLSRNRKLTMEWVAGLDDSILDLKGGHPTMGPSNVETLIFSIYAHQLLHMREIVPYLKS